MNSEILNLKDIYKPYRYIYKGKALIMMSTLGNIVIKEDKNDISQIYEYLENRSFTNFPKLININRNNIDIYEYIEDIDIPKEERALDLIKVLASLHNKTTYFKDVNEKTYQNIYDTINNNIMYLQDTYDKYYELFYHEIMPSPSHYSFLINYSSIKNNLSFSKKTLDNWYEKVKEKKKVRVSLVHNNISLDHFLETKGQNYLISWDKALFDTPILDIINFYHHHYLDLNFEDILKNYLNNYHLDSEELDLLFINLSLPIELKISNNPLEEMQNIYHFLEYIDKTSALIRPYYLDKHKE